MDRGALKVIELFDSWRFTRSGVWTSARLQAEPDDRKVVGLLLLLGRRLIANPRNSLQLLQTRIVRHS